jgi:septum formation protein
MAPRFVLASGSPRRRDLLADARLKFEVIVPAVAESAARTLTIRELTHYNATRKAFAIARINPDAVVLGADTLVALEGEPIGKPQDLGEAVKILRRLSGREHQVCTAVCLVSRENLRSFHVISDVAFHPLSDEQIYAYLAKIEPLDKAGAYAAQGHGREIIRSIRGSYTNVVGLPMGETLSTLADFEIFPGPRAA